MDNGEWVEGNLVVFKEAGQTWQMIFTEKESVEYWINPNTICSFIGMVDQDGKRIWEYDLIKDQFDNLFLISWNPVQCAYYAILIRQHNGKQVRGRFRVGALRHSKLKRIASVFDKGMMQRRWITYFSKWICYPVYR